MQFARNLAELRKNKKVSQRTAAAALGVSQALLSHYEHGLREPGIEFLIRAGQYYGCSVDLLVGIAPDPSHSAAAAAAEALHRDASGELAELADEYLLAAAYRVRLMMSGAPLAKLAEADALLKADELAISRLLSDVPAPCGADGMDFPAELLLAARLEWLNRQNRSHSC